MSTLMNMMPQPISNIIPPNILRGGRANSTVVTVCPASLHCCLLRGGNSYFENILLCDENNEGWRELGAGLARNILLFSHHPDIKTAQCTSSISA